MKKIVFGSFVIGFTLLLFTKCQQRTNNIVTDNGEKLFVNYCAGCHRSNGMGSPTTDLGVNAPDIRKFTKSKSELIGIISNGYGKMPAFGHTTSQDTISMIASYVATKIEGSSSDISTSNGLDQ